MPHPSPVEPDPDTAPQPWTIEDSEELYRVRAWGEPYFSINAAGHLMVSPQGERGGSLDLFELVRALQGRNLTLPLLLRFPDILRDRLDRLHSAFARAIARYGYEGSYRGVFPVKCNQQRHLVESLVRFGEPHQFGLEAGSKPELMIALAHLQTPGALLVCNGYKDAEFLETAFLSQKLGKTVLVVLEQLAEVRLAIEVSRRLGIRPSLGVRAKLATQGEGRWGSSVGERAKFGLGVGEICEAVTLLREAGMLDCLELLHFHIGSQISSIKVIKAALREASRIFTELHGMGAPMRYLDVGGGLAVDYDGSRTNFYASKNYNIQNYANDVVAEVNDACRAAGVPVPTLISESGRALASHQAILVFDILGQSPSPPQAPRPVASEDPLVLRKLGETLGSIGPENLQEAYHDAVEFKNEAVSLFQHGLLNLEVRAQAEGLYWACLRQIRGELRGLEEIPEDLEELDKDLASTYYANLSVFQSAPDAWAIDQLFPILPIHRLEEEPCERVTLADLTCDSDGKIDRFIDLKDVKSLLEAHPLRQSATGQVEPYYMAMFLTGAYQEVMGNLHNLFGDTNAVHIQLTPHGYEIQHVVRGDTMREVLGYVQYDSEDLVERMRQQSERALRRGTISLEESQRLLQRYEASLGRYTYLV